MPKKVDERKKRTWLVEPQPAGPFLSEKAAAASSKRTQPFRDLYRSLKGKSERQ